MALAKGYPKQTAMPGVMEIVTVFEGAGTGAPAQTYVAGGATVTRTAVGSYRITYSGHNGVYVTAMAFVSANTPGDVAGHTVIIDANSYTAAGKALDLVLYNATPAAHDLATAEYITVIAFFRRTGVTK